MSDLVTRDFMCKVLRVTSNGLYSMVNKGLLPMPPVIKIEKRVRYYDKSAALRICNEYDNKGNRRRCITGYFQTAFDTDNCVKFLTSGKRKKFKSYGSTDIVQLPERNIVSELRNFESSYGVTCYEHL